MNRKELLKKVQYCNHIVKTNSVLPILENLYISSGEMTSSNLHITITTKIEYEGEPFLIPGKQLQKILAAIKDEEVSFSVSEDNEIKVKGSTGKEFTIIGDDPEDWVKMPKLEEDGISLSTDFLDKLYLCVRYCSDDDLRPAMTGVCVGVDRIVSTDGHKLVFPEYQNDLLEAALRSINRSHSNPYLILPKKFVEILKRCPEKDKDILISIKMSKENFQVTLKDYTITTTVIDERFPDLMNVIPNHNVLEYKVKKAQLKENVEAALLVANKTTHKIKMSFLTDGGCVISSEDMDFASSFEQTISSETVRYEITHSKEEDPKIKEIFEVGFNGKYLLEIIAGIEGEVVKFEMSEPNKAAIINDYFLLMPIMLLDYV